MSSEALLFINLGVEIIVGIILGVMINSQRAMLNNYKDLLSTIDPKKIKESQDLIEKGLEMKWKAHAAAEIERFSQEMLQSRVAMDDDFANEYNQMMNVLVSDIADRPPAERPAIYTALKGLGPKVRKHVDDEITKRNKEKGGGV